MLEALRDAKAKDRAALPRQGRRPELSAAQRYRAALSLGRRNVLPASPGGGGRTAVLIVAVLVIVVAVGGVLERRVYELVQNFWTARSRLLKRFSGIKMLPSVTL